MMQSQYQIINAEFVTSIFERRTFDSSELTEIAFVGRSNVGKSSLINALVHQRNLAQVSKTPGRTKAINYFKVIIGGQDRRWSAYFVDVPGYGFARVAKSERARWAELVESYLYDNERLKALLLLIDSRRGVEDAEKWLRNFPGGHRLIVVLTKADQLSRAELEKQRREIARDLLLQPDELFVTGLVGKNKTSVDNLLNLVCSLTVPTSDLA